MLCYSYCFLLHYFVSKKKSALVAALCVSCYFRISLLLLACGLAGGMWMKWLGIALSTWWILGSLALWLDELGYWCLNGIWLKCYVCYDWNPKKLVTGRCFSRLRIWLGLRFEGLIKVGSLSSRLYSIRILFKMQDATKWQTICLMKRLS